METSIRRGSVKCKPVPDCSMRKATQLAVTALLFGSCRRSEPLSMNSGYHFDNRNPERYANHLHDITAGATEHPSLADNCVLPLRAKRDNLVFRSVLN